MKIPQNECMNVVKSRLENLVKSAALCDVVSSRTLEVWDVKKSFKTCKVSGDWTQDRTTWKLKKMRGVGFEPTTSQPNNRVKRNIKNNKNNERSGSRTHYLLAEWESKEKM